ncbi:hypothetical protein LVJ83_10195 [Uruburuella testudinis]|uniref:Serine/threonine protein kinase n=1 Tax=Uruburuella testudinis TaxID=1282863 RepID=A0ABY4DSD6_9NEIS|nr:hypothetical protein [Uruburuella testudinis]UOO81328.1 hypothetical protein LVJ83_10195 [Uruburuella testudinis]
MTDYSFVLQQLLAAQTGTICRHTLSDGQTVWVRKTGKSIPPWRYALLGIIARSLHLGALQPVPNLGGSTAIAIEAARLRALAEHNIRTPRLLAESSDGLMFTHIGEYTLLHHIEYSPERLHYWLQGLEAIGNVHCHGEYLSQAFARNIIICNDNTIGFIDFEDDPGQYMPLIRCQSRDYLCYLHSTAIWLQKHRLLEPAARLWQQHLAQLPADMPPDILKASRPIRWMRHLKARFWGSDTLRLAALAAFFEQAR